MAGCPIRISADQWSFAPTRSFSQLITSFIASKSLGIPRAPFVTFLTIGHQFIDFATNDDVRLTLFRNNVVLLLHFLSHYVNELLSPFLI